MDGKIVLIVVIISTLFAATARAGCPAGWLAHASSCYWFTNEKHTFQEAEQYCKQQQTESHLIEVGDSAENTFIKNKLRGMHGAHRWMGLNDLQNEGTWVWIGSSTPTTFTDWFPGQPNSNTGEEDCVIFTNYNGYQWYDVSCDSRYEPICEIPSSDDIVG